MEMKSYKQAIAFLAGITFLTVLMLVTFQLGKLFVELNLILNPLAMVLLCFWYGITRDELLKSATRISLCATAITLIAVIALSSIGFAFSIIIFSPMQFAAIMATSLASAWFIYLEIFCVRLGFSIFEWLRP